MKKIMLVLVAVTTICTVSCKKESVNPESKSIEKTYMSGGGDKRPHGVYD